MSNTPVIPSNLTVKTTAVSALKYQTLSAACAGSLFVPIALLLFHCPAGVRRSPVFVLLLCNLILGVVWAFLSYAENMNSIQDPLGGNSRGLFLGSSSLNFLIPIFTDMSLVWKILWLYPATTYKTWQRALLIAPPCTLFIPRLVIISYYLYNAGKAYDSTGGILAAVVYLGRPRLPLWEFSLQLISNAYCALVLLHKARSLIRIDPAFAVHRSTALQQRFLTMIRVLASSFLIPVCLQIALIAAYAANNADTFIKEPIQWLNTYLSLHCAVLATVWSAIDHLSDPTNPNKTSAMSGTGSTGGRYSMKRLDGDTSQVDGLDPTSGSNRNSKTQSAFIHHYPMSDFGGGDFSSPAPSIFRDRATSISSSTIRTPKRPASASQLHSSSSTRRDSSSKIIAGTLPYESTVHSVDIERGGLAFEDSHLERLTDVESYEDPKVFHIR